MTAEIAVLNRQAVALAADSAVTVGGSQKVFPSAEKIFALSDEAPVGAMVYGSADVLGVPWETVVKDYRAARGRRRFGNLEEYAESFLEFVGSNADFFPERRQRAYIEDRIREYFDALKQDTLRRATLEIDKEGHVTDSRLEAIAEGVIDENWQVLQAGEPLPGIPGDFADEFVQRHAGSISRAIGQTFEKYPLSDASLERLGEMAAELFSSFLEPTPGMSGIVVAGFGEQDVFPAVWRSEIDGVANGQVLRAPQEIRRITTEERALVAPFAQRQMVDVFMHGVDPAYLEVIESAVAAMFRRFPAMLAPLLKTAKVDAKTRDAIGAVVDEMLAELDGALARHRKAVYFDPVVQIVGTLPKDELAAVAEALVSLTAFKQKVSAGLESVGGPIDVAVISRGDGLVWIRRKRYFEAGLNPQFLARYESRERDDST